MGFLMPHVQTPATPAAPSLPPQVNAPQGEKSGGVSQDQTPSFLGAALMPVQGQAGAPGLTGNVPGKSSLGGAQ